MGENMDLDIVIILIIAGFTVMAAIALLIVIKLYLNEKRGLKKSELAGCTEKVLGLVTDFVCRGNRNGDTVTVEYEVTNKKYQIQEPVKKNSQLIATGVLIRETKNKIPVGKVKASTFVDVFYDPEDPQIAYLPENQ